MLCFQLNPPLRPPAQMGVKDQGLFYLTLPSALRTTIQPAFCSTIVFIFTLVRVCAYFEMKVPSPMLSLGIFGKVRSLSFWSQIMTQIFSERGAAIVVATDGNFSHKHLIIGGALSQIL